MGGRPMEPKAGQGTFAEQGPRPAGRNERLQIDVEMLCGLLDRGFEVDGEAVLTESMTWVIYGRTTYDGETILAEYENAEDAAAVIRSMADRSLGDRTDDHPPSGATPT